jgi:hypothetical protein
MPEPCSIDTCSPLCDARSHLDECLLALKLGHQQWEQQDLNLLSLGYEPCDARLCRLGRSLVSALTSRTGNPRSCRIRCVSPVSARPAEARAQIRAQIWFLNCGSSDCRQRRR